MGDSNIQQPAHESHNHSGQHHGLCHVTSIKRVMTLTGTVMVLGVLLVYTLALPPPTFSAEVQPLTSVKYSVEHNKSDTVTRETVRNIRILCLILTMEKDVATKVQAVNTTWVKRCDKHFYVISSAQRRHDFLNIDIPDSRNTLVHKMQKAYSIIYEKYINDFDFLLKADDDSYVIIENMKYLLSNYEGNKPGYIGYHFNKFVPNGYMSGGAGYVISNRGLRHMVENGFRKGLCNVVKNANDPENSEDIETGKCLQLVGVPILSSLDAEGRETFHPYPLEKHLLARLPGYIYSWAKNPVKTGTQCCSRYTISFHYLSTDTVYLLDHLLYQTSVYGLDKTIPHTKPAFNTGKVT